MYSSSSNFGKEIRKGGKQKKKRKEGGKEGRKVRKRETKRVKELKEIQEIFCHSFQVLSCLLNHSDIRIVGFPL